MSPSETFTNFGPQMRVFIFFVYLCFLLLRGYDYVYTGTHYDKINYSRAQHIETPRQAEVANGNLDHSTIRDTGLDEEEEGFISDDEDEEDANGFARKYKLLTNSYLAFSNTFTSGYLHSNLKEHPPFYGYLSYKYITLRTLRI